MSESAGELTAESILLWKPLLRLTGGFLWSKLRQSSEYAQTEDDSGYRALQKSHEIAKTSGSSWISRYSGRRGFCSLNIVGGFCGAVCKAIKLIEARSKRGLRGQSFGLPALLLSNVAHFPYPTSHG